MSAGTADASPACLGLEADGLILEDHRDVVSVDAGAVADGSRGLQRYRVRIGHSGAA